MVTTPRTALITGVTGQDGSYMAELLAQQGYRVFGVTRDPALSYPLNLAHLTDRVSLIYCTYEAHDLFEIVKRVKPQEIYNFTGQSYVGKSWEMVEETFKSLAVIPSRILEAILANDPSIRFLQASSSELFNPQEQDRLDETFPISPYNPYGCSKAFAHTMVAAYRRTHGLFAVNAILFPHESPRRHPNFAFKKIVRAAVEIRKGSPKKLELGNLQVFRDWGYAPEYVSGMHRMILAETPEDYCLCSGAARSVQDVVEAAFSYVGLDWREHVEVSPRLYRTYEPKLIVGDASRAAKHLGWKPVARFEDTLQRVIDFETRMADGSEKDYRNERPGYL